jgi:ankyrin repeat protein
MRAAMSGWPETVRLLLGRGADAKLKDNEGKTALVLAREYRQDEELVEMLQKAGARQKRKD